MQYTFKKRRATRNKFCLIAIKSVIESFGRSSVRIPPPPMSIPSMRRHRVLRRYVTSWRSFRGTPYISCCTKISIQVYCMCKNENDVQGHKSVTDRVGTACILVWTLTDAQHLPLRQISTFHLWTDDGFPFTVWKSAIRLIIVQLLKFICDFSFWQVFSFKAQVIGLEKHWSCNQVPRTFFQVIFESLISFASKLTITEAIQGSVCW